MNLPTDSLLRLPNAADRLQADRTGPSNRQELEQAGRDFEALLLTQLLKSAREASSGGWMGEGSGVEQSVAMEMAESALARAMAADGALGLARLLAEAGSASPTAPDADAKRQPETDSPPTPSRRTAGS